MTIGQESFLATSVYPCTNHWHLYSRRGITGKVISLHNRSPLLFFLSCICDKTFQHYNAVSKKGSLMDRCEMQNEAVTLRDFPKSVLMTRICGCGLSVHNIKKITSTDKWHRYLGRGHLTSPNQLTLSSIISTYDDNVSFCLVIFKFAMFLVTTQSSKSSFCSQVEGEKRVS